MITDLLASGPQDFLTITVPKPFVKDFFATKLADILSFISQRAKGLIFVPMEISESVAMPAEEIIVTMRNSRNLKNIPLDGWFTNDIAHLCSKFHVRTMNFSQRATDVKEISDNLQRELKQLSQAQGLNLIGGYQASNSSFEALFFKLDVPAVQLYFMKNLICDQWGAEEEQLQ